VKANDDLQAVWRALLAPGPARLGALASVAGLLGVGAGCTCDYTVITRLPADTYDRLFAEHGSDPLPTEVCVELCAPGSAATGTADTGYGQRDVLGCRLVRVDWTDEGVVCDMTDHGCGIGRRPPGLAGSPAPGRSLGAWLASSAHLELASVAAFLRLAHELEHHGAPAPLVEAARRAAADEVRHADATARRARREGVEPPPVHLTPTPPRSLLELALDNAREGCAGEAMGAVLASHAAQHVSDGLRELFGPIAAEEAGHAVLSLAIHRWALERLPAAAAEQVRQEARSCIARWQPPPRPRPLGRCDPRWLQEAREALLMAV
jgi:hypothetical protein